MAQFRATIKGHRGGIASRLGGKESGISAHVAGWLGGIRVVASVDKFGKDRFDVYYSAGSKAPESDDVLIGHFIATVGFIPAGTIKDVRGETVDAREVLRRGVECGIFDDAPEFKADVLEVLS